MKKKLCAFGLALAAAFGGAAMASCGNETAGLPAGSGDSAGGAALPLTATEAYEKLSAEVALVEKNNYTFCEKASLDRYDWETEEETTIEAYGVCKVDGDDRALAVVGVIERQNYYVDGVVYDVYEKSQIAMDFEEYEEEMDLEGVRFCWDFTFSRQALEALSIQRIEQGYEICITLEKEEAALVFGEFLGYGGEWEELRQIKYKLGCDNSYKLLYQHFEIYQEGEGVLEKMDLIFEDFGKTVIDLPEEAKAYSQKTEIVHRQLTEKIAMGKDYFTVLASGEPMENSVRYTVAGNDRSLERLDFSTDIWTKESWYVDGVYYDAQGRYKEEMTLERYEEKSDVAGGISIPYGFLPSDEAFKNASIEETRPQIYTLTISLAEAEAIRFIQYLSGEFSGEEFLDVSDCRVKLVYSYYAGMPFGEKVYNYQPIEGSVYDEGVVYINYQFTYGGERISQELSFQNVGNSGVYLPDDADTYKNIGEPTEETKTAVEVFALLSADLQSKKDNYTHRAEAYATEKTKTENGEANEGTYTLWDEKVVGQNIASHYQVFMGDIGGMTEDTPMSVTNKKWYVDGTYYRENTQEKKEVTFEEYMQNHRGGDPLLFPMLNFSEWELEDAYLASYEGSRFLVLKRLSGFEAKACIEALASGGNPMDMYDYWIEYSFEYNYKYEIVSVHCRAEFRADTMLEDAYNEMYVHWSDFGVTEVTPPENANEYTEME